MNNTTLSSVVFNLSREVNRVGVYVWPVLIALIALTNTMNIIVLSRRSLRSSSCIHYFLALSIGSLIYMLFTPINLFILYSFGFEFSPSLIGCRITQFFALSSALFTTAMLVCSSIDRFCSSSSSSWLRRFATVRIAKRIIIILSISILVYMSPFILIFYWNSDTNQCFQYSSTLISIYLYSRMVLYYIVEPIMMIIFGLLTINNIRHQTRRVAPLAGQNNRRTENQLTRILIIQVGLYLLFALPGAVTYTIQTFIPSIVTPLVTGFRTITVMWQQGTFFLPFFLYTLSATTFRNEFLKLFKLYNVNNQPTIITTRTQRQILTQWIHNTRI